MKKSITVNFDSDFVLGKASESKLPVDKCIELLKELFPGDIRVLKKDFTTCVAVVELEETKAEKAAEELKTALARAYGADDLGTAVNVDIGEYVPDEEKTVEAPQKANETAQKKPEAPDKNSAPEEESSEPKKKAVELIDELVGAAEIKALAREMIALAPQIRAHKTADVFKNRAYLISVDSGCGFTTYVDLLMQLMNEEGICEKSKRSDCVLPEKDEDLKSMIRSTRFSDSRDRTILSVDLTPVMRLAHMPLFRELLNKLNDSQGIKPIFFRVPYLEDEVLKNLESALNDLFAVKTVCVPQFTNAELRTAAERILGEYDYVLSDGAWSVITCRLAEERSDGRFYGMKTLKKVLDDAIILKQLSDIGKEGRSLMTGQDIASLSDFRMEEKSAEEMFGGLIGIENVRKRLYEIVDQIEYAKKHVAGKQPCIHMQFIGAPGTGKTTIARIVGKLFRERGILKDGYFFEYTGLDLIGQYVGSTAPKTAAICRDAYGSVLFIDEAYSLYTKDSGSNNYGKEALATLISEMENHRSDLVVIFAGYRKEMEELMEGNPGLRSRIPFVIDFNNYTREELVEIFLSMKDSPLAEGTEEKVRDYFMHLPDELLEAQDFSNARFVRNLYERTCNKAISRCRLNNVSGLTILPEDFELAVADGEFGKYIPKKRSLGFV